LLRKGFFQRVEELKSCPHVNDSNTRCFLRPDAHHLLCAPRRCDRIHPRFLASEAGPKFGSGPESKKVSCPPIGPRIGNQLHGSHPPDRFHDSYGAVCTRWTETSGPRTARADGRHGLTPCLCGLYLKRFLVIINEMRSTFFLGNGGNPGPKASPSTWAVAVGRTSSGQPILAALAELPHMDDAVIF